MKKQNKKTTVTIEDLAKQALATLERIEKLKAEYNELERLTEQAVQLSKTDKAQLQKLGLIVVDNFAAKNSVFRTTSVKRFELKRS
jgi:hypothetical protein